MHNYFAEAISQDLFSMIFSLYWLVLTWITEYESGKEMYNWTVRVEILKSLQYFWWFPMKVSNLRDMHNILYHSLLNVSSCICHFCEYKSFSRTASIQSKYNRVLLTRKTFYVLLMQYLINNWNTEF